MLFESDEIQYAIGPAVYPAYIPGATRGADATEYDLHMEGLLQRLSTSKTVIWLMSQAVVLATTCLYALTLYKSMVAHYDDRYQFSDLGVFQTMGLCVVLALPVLLVRRLPTAVFATILGESVLGDIFGARPSIVFFLIMHLSLREGA